jgi:4-amino-4-deoxy-L-arabinose transferase-like glycosyltransferase
MLSMGTDPNRQPSSRRTSRVSLLAWTWLTALAALVGFTLIVHESFASSATYDEVTYLRISARWWRTGDQTEITRMGSPLTFWKLQQIPVFWLLDWAGRREWVNDPIGHQLELLPLARLGSAWIWLVAFGVTAAWSHRSHGPCAMALAAWLFALSPNLLAHGALATMELPLVACTTAMFCLFWRFLETNRSPLFWAAAAVGGLSFSCKFTAVLIPPILAVVWWIVCYRKGERKLFTLTWRVVISMVGFLLMLMLVDAAVTGFARLPLSTGHGHHPTAERWFGPLSRYLVAYLYEIPLPQDWVGFATQMHHQASGGPSYLFGETRMKGWWYYYLVAIAVKVPLTFWILVATRLRLQRRCAGDRRPTHYNSLLPLVFLLYIGITAIGSSRNYGVRYLLPLAPLAIVWISAIGEQIDGCTRQIAVFAWCTTLVGLVGYAGAVVVIHPHELTYFNTMAGGPLGGRRILADSNLDWGQGLKSLARLQRQRPELTDITLYYFGNTEPVHYRVTGLSQTISAVDDNSRLPSLDSLQTRFLAVSASLEWGPWGPPGFFKRLKGLNPVQLTDDTTIAIYRTSDLRQLRK